MPAQGLGELGGAAVERPEDVVAWCGYCEQGWPQERLGEQYKDVRAWLAAHFLCCPKWGSWVVLPALESPKCYSGHLRYTHHVQNSWEGS